MHATDNLNNENARASKARQCAAESPRTIITPNYWCAAR